MVFDALCSQPGIRAIGEPFEERKHPIVRKYLQHPDSRLPAIDHEDESGVRAYIDALRSGRFVGGFERVYDPRNVRHQRITNRNVFKILRTLPATEWYLKNYPNAFHLVLFRHPIPTVLSRMRLGWHAPVESMLSFSRWFDRFSEGVQDWIRRQSGRDQFCRHLAVWLMEHSGVPALLARGPMAQPRLLAFEHVVADPSGCAADLALWLGLPHPDKMSAALGLPSRSSSHSTPETVALIRNGNPGAILSAWQHSITPSQRELVREGLEQFQINWYSANAVEPLAPFAEPPWL